MSQPADHCNGKARTIHLAQNDRADLAKSGLSDATISAAGLYTETHAGKIQTAMNWQYPRKQLGPCLAFPFFDTVGNRIDGYLRLKPTIPRTGKDGRIIKYESPVRVPNHPYFPP